MQRPNFRHPGGFGGPSPRPGGFRSPPPGFGGGQSGMESPPWGFPCGPPSPYMPRFGKLGGSPNSPSGDFRGSDGNFNRGGGSGGKPWQRGSSPGSYTPRRPYENNRGFSPRYSPFQSPSPRHGGYQGSPRTSTPSRSSSGRGADNVENYYKPSMVQDPWASLKPVSVKDVQDKCGTPKGQNACRKNRYF
ncbi:M-phase-specific PLK1-interacting protein [Engraulis encrasicolus]|uniref:M-phase-specific PLK1-interacting protein n=1 Tax=Engraulis encrasicolus TaxID=184585 RepID=UPI002FD7207C